MVSTPGATLQMPDDDPSDPNANKITPGCVRIDMTKFQSMGEIVPYLEHVDRMKDGFKFTLAIDDCVNDAAESSEIVDFAEGNGVEYIVLKGCNRDDKFGKI